ncbi:hypothetical protein HanPI659440_Chr13g0499831 [Helianthus annuus]|nr:hypothetical protein HanPI659440_Chr13g0499831 [Helianthus annuus]
MVMCRRELVRGSPCFACRTLGRTTEECGDFGLEPNLTEPNRTKLNRTESRPHNYVSTNSPLDAAREDSSSMPFVTPPNYHLGYVPIGGATIQQRATNHIKHKL